MNEVQKSRGLSLAVRFFLVFTLGAWFMYVLQFIGFLTLGIGGFIVSSLINASYLQLWHPLVAAILLLLVIFGWKRIPNPIYALAASVGTLILIFSNFFPILVTAVIGFVLVAVALVVFNRGIVHTVGPINFFVRILPYILFIAVVFGTIIYASYSVTSDIRKARSTLTPVR